jgi:predicted TIM-barrel fold metal-dependent hydrolase
VARRSEAPNLRVKLSGIGVPGRAWTAELNRYLVLEAAALFGAARCMVASNFPVGGLAAGYAAIMQGMREIAAGMPRADRLRIFCGTAAGVDRVALPEA